MTKHTLIRAVAWLMLSTLVVLSLVPLPDTHTAIPNSDKWLHLSSYFLLTYWFLHAYSVHIVRIFYGLVVLGFALEGLQFLTGLRHMELWDGLMNSLGVIMAICAFKFLNIKLPWLLLKQNHPHQAD